MQGEEFEQCPVCGKPTPESLRFCEHCMHPIRELTPEERRADWAGLVFGLSFATTWVIGGATCAMHDPPDGTVHWMRQYAELIISSLWALSLATGGYWYWTKKIVKR